MKLQKYTRREDFTYDRISCVSIAAAPICGWVRGIDAYAKTYINQDESLNVRYVEQSINISPRRSRLSKPNNFSNISNLSRGSSPQHHT